MSRRLRTVAVRAWRLAALLGLALAIGSAHRTGRAGGPMPLGVREVVRLLPAAASIDPEPGPRGQVVRDAAGAPLGTALTTAPDGDEIVGYAGPTEVLVALDDEGHVAGARIRRSDDTPEHVGDVAADARFWQRLVGRSASELAGRTATELRVDGVSGATATSLAVVDAIGVRLDRARAERTGAGLRVNPHDLALVAFALGGVLIAFHRGVRRRLRRPFQVAAIAYLGFATAELLALSLGAGFARNGLPWARSPGLALLAAAAWLVPWATGRNAYCGHVCPHGALQEWIGRAARGRVPRARIPVVVRSTLGAIPATLLVCAVIALTAGMPLDLATVEAFDGWLLGAGALASIVIAVAGLAAAAFEPMAYCRHGCATGRLLGLGATHRASAERLDRRDALLAALLLVAVTILAFRTVVRDVIAELPL